MEVISVKNIKAKEIVPGFHGRFIHSENITIAYWDIKAGHSVPRHQHVHEMIVNVMEGKLELTVGNDTKLLETGMAVVIPSNVPHMATGVTDCKIIDVFYPVRSDYNNDK
jgi:quercetin dioxygenase-like cupin family protein